MGTRGPKSGSEVATMGMVALVNRPDAPLDLTPEQSDAWREIVDALPADWFSKENHPLLAQYCRHVVSARRVAQLIDAECSKADVDIKSYTDLLAAETKQTAALRALAASMRLAQQSRYETRGAATASKRGKTVKRPWES